MITTFDDTVKKYQLDIGRPSFFSDTDCLEWQKFFTYVETASISIQVNGMYHPMRKLAFDLGRYGGGGYAFCFWFDSKQSRREFADEVGKIFNQTVEDWRNVMFYSKKNDKTGEYEIEGLRFDQKYLDYANQTADQFGLTVEKQVIQSECYFCRSPTAKETGHHMVCGLYDKLAKFKAALNEYFFELD